MNLKTPLCLVLAMLPLALTLGCSETTGPQRVAVSGTVTLDGSPVSGVSVILNPLGPDGLSAVAFVENGEFTLPEDRGPTAGSISVRFNPEGAELEEALERMQSNSKNPFQPVQIPECYQRDRAFEKTITETGPNRFAFELHSKFRP